MNICLIGASGFVGTRLIESLITEYQVKNIDKQQSSFYPNITEITDVRNQELLNAGLRGQDVVVLLAAEHRDDVSPLSLYYDVNVQGTMNVLSAMEVNEVKHLIFTSSVAVYGLNKKNPNEQHPVDPFNHYGKSKWQAEEAIQRWYDSDPSDKIVNIIRPTVIFGERNRGNVYNLLKQISSGRFLMVGSGKNQKSMAYVGNVVSFIKYCIDHRHFGYEIYNYIDKPDFDMNTLVSQVGLVLKRKVLPLHIPYILGLGGGYCFDLFSKILRKKLPVSSVRVKKFCATTQFDSGKLASTGFRPPFSLAEGLKRTLTYEFITADSDKDGVVFISE